MAQKAYIKPTTLIMPAHLDTALLDLYINTRGKKEEGNAWEEAASKGNQTEDDLWDE